ncbi:MAG: hypothetical protein JWN86_1382 [Planctomycetota bacterium]|nr:hypothetical protein [Planctomycetota bacterium]
MSDLCPVEIPSIHAHVDHDAQSQVTKWVRYVLSSSARSGLSVLGRRVQSDGLPVVFFVRGMISDGGETAMGRSAGPPLPSTLLSKWRTFDVMNSHGRPLFGAVG